MKETQTIAIWPAPGVAGVEAYRVAKPDGRIDLHLDGNEGAAPPAVLLELIAELGPETLRRYPRTEPLEALLAARFGVSPGQVVVTAGADDALDRACRAALGPGRELILPVPTFEMLERYPPLVGAAAGDAPAPPPASTPMARSARRGLTTLTAWRWTARATCSWLTMATIRSAR